jgi:phosphate transport system substrate-binding protein
MTTVPISRRRTAAVGALLLSFALHATASADLRVSGSETLEPYFQDALSQFARSDGAGIAVEATYKGSQAGWKDLCSRQAAIAPSSSKMDEKSARLCQDEHVAVVALPLAYDAIAVIANPRLAAAGQLNMEELKAIFSADNTGKVVRWSQVRAGLPDGPLTVVSLDPHSGTTAFFTGAVTPLRGFVRGDAKVTASHEEVIRMVAADPNAIGFVSARALAESKAAVWRVPLNFGRGPVVASTEAVLNGSYGPLSRLLYVYASKASLAAPDGHARLFLKWLMEHAGKLAPYENFIPLIPQDYQNNLRAISGE